VTTVPHQNKGIAPKVQELENVTITTFVESDFFSVYKWEVSGKAAFSFNDQYLLFSVIKGAGTFNHDGESHPLKKGTHFIVPVGLGEFEVDGTLEFIVSQP
jgi:mannose-6-phosphate isomerase